MSAPRPGTTGSYDDIPLWKLIAALLPQKAPDEWYTIKEIAPLLGLKPRSLMEHAQGIWRDWDGHYRLDHAQAQRLIRKVCQSGRKLPSRASIIEQLHAKGIDAR